MVGSLHEFSFVRQSLETNDVVSIHPLIHQWSAEYSRSFGGLGCLMVAAASMLANAVPRTYTNSVGLPYDQIQPHYDRWYSSIREDATLATIVGCKASFELLRFRLSQAALEETLPFLRTTAANALSRHGWAHNHTTILNLPLANALRHFSAGTFQEGVDLLEKLAPHALKARFLPTMSAADDQAIVESVILYHRFLLYEVPGSDNVLPVRGSGPGDKERADSIVRRIEEICSNARELYVYPYLCWLRFSFRWQRLGYNNLVVSDEDVGATQRVLDMLEREIFGRHPFAPPPAYVSIFKASLLKRKGVFETPHFPFFNDYYYSYIRVSEGS